MLRLALADAIAAHGDDRCAAWPLLHIPVRCRYGPQAPGDVTLPFDLSLAVAPVDTPAVAELIANQPKPSAAAVFDGDQKGGAGGLGDLHAQALGVEPHLGNIEAVGLGRQ